MLHLVGLLMNYIFLPHAKNSLFFDKDRSVTCVL